VFRLFSLQRFITLISPDLYAENTSSAFTKISTFLYPHSQVQQTFYRKFHQSKQSSFVENKINEGATLCSQRDQSIYYVWIGDSALIDGKVEEKK